MELLNEKGLRVDGRKPDELRLIKCKLGVFSHADGSAYLEQGNTKVLAVVYGPREVRNTHRSKMSAEGAYVNCQYSMTAFSTSERKKKNRGDRKSTEATILLHQALASVIRTELMPKSQIDIFVEVVEAGGGNLSSSVNAATLALIDAGVPLREYVIAATASLAGGVPLVDLSHLEQTLGGPSLTVALLPRSGQALKKTLSIDSFFKIGPLDMGWMTLLQVLFFIDHKPIPITTLIALMEMSQRFHLDYLDPVLKMAMRGCDYTFRVLDLAVVSYLSEIGAPNNWAQS